MHCGHGAPIGGGAVVVINDAAAVERLASVQVGARATIDLGGRGSVLSDPPMVALAVKLLSRSDGEFTLENPHSHLASMVGLHVSMGPCAVVCVVDRPSVRVLITSKPTPPFDLGQLRSQGIVPEEQDMIGVKAAVAHRAAYDPIAFASFTVATPGPCTSDLRMLPYRYADPSNLYPLVDNPTIGWA
jgi:microcystin degradation protein MlrC